MAGLGRHTVPGVAEGDGLSASAACVIPTIAPPPPELPFCLVALVTIQQRLTCHSVRDCVSGVAKSLRGHGLSLAKEVSMEQAGPHTQASKPVQL